MSAAALSAESRFADLADGVPARHRGLEVEAAPGEVIPRLLAFINGS